MSSPPNRRNYYRVLHVQPDAPHEVVKSSYRALMMSLDMHPDRGGEHWNAALINEAYAVLSDPATRAEYDASAVGVERDLPADRATPSGGDATERFGKRARAGVGYLGCLFCGAEPVGQQPASICPNCRSPVTPAGAPQLDASGRRAARRVSKHGRIAYFVDWPQPAPQYGQIVDLSPGGLRFVSDDAIERHRIIKLQGQLLEAVARVAACHQVDGSFAVGVQFYTVRFQQGRGTFLSTRA